MEQATLTAEQFEQAYAERSGRTVESLRAAGRVVRPCDCGENICEGWQYVPQWLADEIDDPALPGVR